MVTIKRDSMLEEMHHKDANSIEISRKEYMDNIYMRWAESDDNLELVEMNGNLILGEKEPRGVREKRQLEELQGYYLIDGFKKLAKHGK